MQNDLREAVARIIFPENERVKVDKEWAGNRKYSRGRWNEALTKADDILALIQNRPFLPNWKNGASVSARPLALGGQQGDATVRDMRLSHWAEVEPFAARAEAQDEGAEMTRLLKLADSALANVTAFEDDARYIMGNTNYAITENARSEIRSFLLAQSAKTSVRPKALEILERLLDHSGARGSFDAMKHGDAVKDAEELLRSARSPGHTDLMVTPESIDAYMRVNPMEAQDEGAAGEASAYRVRMISDDPAEWVLMHPEKALDFLSRKGWESQPLYSHPSPPPAADADRVRELETVADLADELINRGGLVNRGVDRGLVVVEKADRSDPHYRLCLALEALKSTAAKEGGE